MQAALLKSMDPAIIRCVKPCPLAWLVYHALPFIRAPRQQRLTSPPHHHRRPQMDFRQACAAQRQRPLWHLQQANYGSCVFAVRFSACIRHNLAQALLHSGILPMRHALLHWSANSTTDGFVRNCRRVQRRVVAALGEARGIRQHVATAGLVQRSVVCGQRGGLRGVERCHSEQCAVF